MSRFLRRFVAVPLAATALLSFAATRGLAASEQWPAGGSAAIADVSAANRDNNGRIARPELEVVESTGRNIPNPLIPQRIESFVTETVTTSQAGRLLVTKSMDLATTCTPTSGVLYFLIVDDVPIRNSAVFSRTGIEGQVSGVTTDIVDAGAHTIMVGEVCTVPGATPTGATVALIGITSVVVLP